MPDPTEETAAEQEDAQAHIPPRRDRGPGIDPRIVWGVVAAVVVVIVVIVGARVVISGKTGTVPNVAGLSQAAATKAIQDAGFEVGRVMTEETTASPAGTVLQQAPEAGVTVSKDTVVEIVLAQKLQRVKAPSVVGDKAAEASSTLAAGGFAPILYSDFDTGTPAGVVYGQAPAAGSDIPTGSPVVFAVSKGPRPAGAAALVSVPPVAGQPIEAATTAIRQGFLKQTTQEMASDVIIPGIIMIQFPDAGSKVPKGSTVLVVVSVGPHR